MPHKDYDERKAYFRKWAVKKRMDNKVKAIEYLGGKCYTEGCNIATMTHHLDLHHTEGKQYHFGPLMQHSWEKVKKEIDDCKAILLCAICHRDITWKGSGKPLNSMEGMK